jgi:hypothetical protein
VPSHGTNRGSNPLRDANKINNLDDATQVISNTAMVHVARCQTTGVRSTLTSVQFIITC